MHSFEELSPSRRGFLFGGAVVGLVAIPVAEALSQEEKKELTPQQQLLEEQLKARFGKFLSVEEIRIIRLEIQRLENSAKALTRTPLNYMDDPGAAFRAD